jgi:hypothetical protein
MDKVSEARGRGGDQEESTEKSKQLIPLGVAEVGFSMLLYRTGA